MKSSKTIICVITFCLLIGLVATGSILKMEKQQGRLEEILLQEKAASLQMPFIKNTGQIDETVAYYAPIFGGTVFVTNDGQIVYSLSKKVEGEEVKSVALKEQVIGKKVEMIVGQKPATTQVNYFKGNDQKKWFSSIPTYTMVSLGELYRGINLNLRAYGNNVEKLFVVEPGAEPEQIKLRLEGAESLSIDEKGQLVVTTALGLVAFTKPVAYQEIDGTKRNVEAAYILNSANHNSEIENRKSTYGFAIGQYNPDYELIIDPLLVSTFLKSNGYSYGIALDSNNNVYVTGYTGDPEFPTAGSPYDNSYSGSSDVFISKLDSSLSTLIASTFLGGSNSDYSYGIVLDSSNNVYVTGYTGSTDFPTAGTPYDDSHGGGSFDDVFISKLDSNLSSLIASTFLGGSKGDDGYGIALDSNNNVYVAGHTYSQDFPTAGTPYDDSHDAASDAFISDVFISKLDSNLSSLSASTFLGGEDSDYSYGGIVLDSSNNVYVAGETFSPNFPTAGTPYDNSHNESSDVFISKLDSNLSTLSASTFLGGVSSDASYDITLDSDNNIYVTGYTYSHDFPTAGSPYDNSYSGSSDVFISKLDSNLSTLSASTFLGGSDEDYGYAIALDVNSNAHLTGFTSSTDFPTVGHRYDSSHNGSKDVFVSKLDSSLNTLNVSTFLGGSNEDAGYAIVLDGNGNIHVTGNTQSTGFPVAGSPYDGSHNGSNDVFVSKLGILTLIKDAPAHTDPGQTITYTISIANNGPITATNAIISDSLPTGLNFVGPVTLDPPQGQAILATEALSLPTLASNITITVGQQITFTFPVTVGLELVNSSFTNIASVTSTEMVEPANGTATTGTIKFFLPVILKYN